MGTAVPCHPASLLVLSWAFVRASAIDNGLGLRPPRGWRSWNAFDCTSDEKIITQKHMQDQMLAVVDTSRTVDGRPMSLAQLGFDMVSMDDGWQQCNCSTRQDIDPHLPACPNLCFGGHCTFHDEAGVPRVRADRFSDMKNLVDYGHSLGLKVGSYLNNCICMEAGRSPTHYVQDVQWMMDMGFDGVKIDGCGSSHNVSYYADLFNATGKPIEIENCHNSWPDFATGFCPMNFFRSGGDISANIGDIMVEAYATVDAADLPEPRSRPGCWAYPDMSEVGNFPPGPSQVDQERTHWGLWCIVSSPLILGFDMSDAAKMDRVWPIITNTDALAVSEAWAGHPGTLIKAYPAVGQGLQLVQGQCDGGPGTLGWRFDGGKFVAPALAGVPAPQCVRTAMNAACPPPTTHFRDVQCGLLLGNCSEVSQGTWNYSANRVRWSDGNPRDNPQCLAAHPLNFDVTKGYFTRQAATVKMEGCRTAEYMLGNSSCAATHAGIDVNAPGVITPADTSKVCGVNVEACCSVCNADPACKAFVWKTSEPYGPGCGSGRSYCWLLSSFSGTHRAVDGVFGSKDPTPIPPPLPPTGPAEFTLTARGELKTTDERCLTAAPINGVQLWSKPVSASKVAVLLVNPFAAPQALSFPLADVPEFPGVERPCVVGGCSVRDVWAQKDQALASDHIPIALDPYASAFFILTSHAPEHRSIEWI